MAKIAVLLAEVSQKMVALSIAKPIQYFSLSLSMESITLLEEIGRNHMTGM